MSKKSNGEGSIYKRKDGKFAGQITTGRDLKGKLIRKTVYGDTKTEVLKKLDTVKRELALGLYTQPDKTIVYDWVFYWLNSYKKIKLKPRTFDSYEQLINNYIKPDIGHLLIQKLTTKDIQLMYNARFESSLSANTIRKIQNVLKPALKQAVTEGLLIKNPAEFVQLPEIQKKDIKAFTKDEQFLFEQTAKQYRQYEAFIINLDTGLRTSEILALEWDDIEFEEGKIIVNKNLVHIKNRKDNSTTVRKLLLQDSSKTKNSTRIIPLTQRSIKLLKELKLKQQSLSNIVFCSKAGTYLTPRNYARTFQKVLKKANIEMCSPHTMRHTFATRLFEAGVPAKTISQLLGHASVAFTLDTYTHVLPNTKKEAIELLEKGTATV